LLHVTCLLHGIGMQRPTIDAPAFDTLIESIGSSCGFPDRIIEADRIEIMKKIGYLDHWMKNQVMPMWDAWS